MYSPVTAALTFPLLIPHFSLLLCFSFLSVPLYFFSLPPPPPPPHSLLPDALPCLLLNRMSLRRSQEPCFYGSGSQASKSAGYCSANVWGQISHSGSPANSQTSSIASHFNPVVLKHPQATVQLLLLQRALLRPSMQRGG